MEIISRILPTSQCVANGAYQWGFSKTATFAFKGLNAAWVAETYAIWLHVSRVSESYSRGRRLGKYRATLGLAEAIRNDLGTDAGILSEEDSERQLKRRPGLRYYMNNVDDDVALNIGVPTNKKLIYQDNRTRSALRS